MQVEAVSCIIIPKNIVLIQGHLTSIEKCSLFREMVLYIFFKFKSLWGLVGTASIIWNTIKWGALDTYF